MAPVVQLVAECLRGYVSWTTVLTTPMAGQRTQTTWSRYASITTT